MEYLVNNSHNVEVNNNIILTNRNIMDAINFCNIAIRKLYEQTKEFDINIFEILGMRNLSGMVGEYFAKSVQKFSGENLHSNLHQDGYPDLLLIDTEDKKQYFNTLFFKKDGKIYPKDKSLFSPYKYGGIEIKATCGSTPSASHIAKPAIGDQRIRLVNKFDWKAHHRGTNNLLAVFWDFIEEVPTIVACFYRNDLTVDDWGKIVQPKEGAGRTTSVSIMNSNGVKKMCDGWIAFINKSEYIEVFNNRWIHNIK